MYYHSNFLIASSNLGWKKYLNPVNDGMTHQESWFLQNINTYGNGDYITPRIFIVYVISSTISSGALILAFQFGIFDTNLAFLIDGILYIVPLLLMFFLWWKTPRYRDSLWLYQEMRFIWAVFFSTISIYLLVTCTQAFFGILNSLYLQYFIGTLLGFCPMTCFTVYITLRVPGVWMETHGKRLKSKFNIGEKSNSKIKSSHHLGFNFKSQKTLTLDNQRSLSNSQNHHHIRIDDIIAKQEKYDLFMTHLMSEYSMECLMSVPEFLQFKHLILDVFDSKLKFIHSSNNNNNNNNNNTHNSNIHLGTGIPDQSTRIGSNVSSQSQLSNIDETQEKQFSTDTEMSITTHMNKKSNKHNKNISTSGTATAATSTTATTGMAASNPFDQDLIVIVDGTNSDAEKSDGDNEKEAPSTSNTRQNSVSGRRDRRSRGSRSQRAGSRTGAASTSAASTVVRSPKQNDLTMSIPDASVSTTPRLSPMVRTPTSPIGLRDRFDWGLMKLPSTLVKSAIVFANELKLTDLVNKYIKVIDEDFHGILDKNEIEKEILIEMKRIITELYEKYVKIGSRFEINISSFQRKELYLLIDKTKNFHLGLRSYSNSKSKSKSNSQSNYNTRNNIHNNYNNNNESFFECNVNITFTQKLTEFYELFDPCMTEMIRLMDPSMKRLAQTKQYLKLEKLLE